jgi:hypothetical protein
MSRKRDPTSRKRRIVQTANDTAESIVKKVDDEVRRGLRRTFKERGANWKPLWLKSDDGDTWRIERIYRADPELKIRLSDLSQEVRSTVAKLLEFLDEQAWMARVAQNIAGEAVRRDFRIGKGSKDATLQFVQNRARPKLDDLIRGFLVRGERLPVQEWMDEYEIPRSTLYDRIGRIRHKLENPVP